MTRVVSLEDFTPGERFDGLPWVEARIEEAPATDGPFTALETQALDPLDPDPSEPQSRNFTTPLATLASGYYRVVFIDAASHEQPVGPIFSDSRTQAYTSVLAVRRILAPDGSRDATLGTAASLSDAEIESAIEEAVTELNGSLATRYTLPFAEIPPLVERLNRDIAAYMATLTYRRNNALDPNDPVRLRYTRAMQLLADIAAGRVQLPIPEGRSEPKSAGAEVVNPYDGSLFSADDFDLAPVAGRQRWEASPSGDVFF